MSIYWLLVARECQDRMQAKTKHFSFSSISSDTDIVDEDEVDLFSDADDDDESKVKPGMLDDSEETEDDSEGYENPIEMRNLNDIRRNTAKYVYLLVE